MIKSNKRPKKITIFSGFMPNSTRQNTCTATSYLVSPKKWKCLQQGNYVEIATQKLKQLFNINNIWLLDSGRSSLQFALNVAGIGKGDHVLVQAFTCLVVINAIKWVGATPIYLDIDDDWNINPRDIEKKLTNKTKAIIIQHTFGKPAKLEKIIPIAKTHNLTTIEDCAHTFLAKTEDKTTLLGTVADMAIFSFGSEKIISCSRGGAVFVNKKSLVDKAIHNYDTLCQIPKIEIIKNLIKYPIFAIAKPTYHLYIGKIILKIASTFGITSPIITVQEKQGIYSSQYPAKLANALAHILVEQIEQYQKDIEHRKSIENVYQNIPKNTSIEHPKIGSWIYVRYPIKTAQKKEIINKAKQQGILLGDWYKDVVVPNPIAPNTTNYIAKSCPNAEMLAEKTINLPTSQSISINDAERIVIFLKTTCTQ